MAADDLKSRIEALNKKPLKNVPEDVIKNPRKERSKAGVSTTIETAASVTVSFDGHQDAELVKAIAVQDPFDLFEDAESIASEDSVILEDAVEGVFLSAPTGPGYYHIEKPAVSLEAGADLMHKRLLRVLGYPDGKTADRLARACKSEKLVPDEIVFLDLETTGLSMTPVFLIGTMECAPDGLVFKQYFARTYTEEASIVSAFAQRLKDARMVVTFNGKSFDMPFLARRADFVGVTLPEPEFHLDLLHESRRMYKRDLPNCRLQTLEQMVCGRCRDNDIPSAQIPRAYHDWGDSGDASQIVQILEHNLHDLLTMADLMHRMWYRD